ncbi:MAG: 3-methyl-2-oxobutanoate hydroxymethyltransferase [Nitrospinota bacterium]
MERTKVTTVDILEKKRTKTKITALSVYDFQFARIADRAGTDILLVGDSLGTVLYGHENTLQVTMEDMVRHTKAVKKGAEKSLIIADMPFMSYQASIDSAIENAGRLIQEGGAEGVKVEGGEAVMDTIEAIAEMGIPVVAHVGLTPQFIHSLGGYRVQGRKSFEAKKIIEDAIAVADAGAFSIVLEGIPLEVAREITNRIAIPTIGIGAGPFCDGQVMVLHDLIGLSGNFKPKFVKRYADLEESVLSAAREFVREVNERKYPDEETSYSVDKGHLRPVRKKT